MTGNDRRVAIITGSSQGIDTLVNNAGVFVSKPFTDYTRRGLRPDRRGRVGQVSDVVDGILFLESSPYVTGEILHIDGGQIAGR